MFNNSNESLEQYCLVITYVQCNDDCDDRGWYKPQKSSNNGQGSDSEMSEMSAMSDLKRARERMSENAQRP